MTLSATTHNTTPRPLNANMNKRLLSLMPLYLFALGALLCLSSCVKWVAVSTHSYPDSVGKMVYVPIKDDTVKLFELNGRKYARIPYYQVPAKGALLSYCYEFKHREVEKFPASDIPSYREGMPKYYLYVLQGGSADIPADERLLSDEAFKDKKPVGTCTYFRIDMPANAYFTPERSTANYLMMPITAPLWVADAGLSAAATVGAYVLYNIPLGICILTQALISL